MTEKQRRWIDYYIETGNAAEAVRLAGYRVHSDKSTQNIGAENLAKLGDFVRSKLAAKEDARIAKQDEVLKYLTAIMRGEETEEIVVVEGCGDGCSSARRMEKSVGARDRIRAAELLAKRYGLLTDKVDLMQPVTIKMIDDYGDSSASPEIKGFG